MKDGEAEKPPRPGIRDLRDHIPFKIHRLDIANERLGHRVMMDNFGVTMPQYRVIGVIGAIGPKAPVGDVLAELGMNKSQLSREIKVLMRSGLMISEEDSEDRRRMRLSLTERGQRLHDRMLAYVMERNLMALAKVPEELRPTLNMALDAMTEWVEHRLKELDEK
jgi:DNA-binding MarR family transcriptional regulator